jgi:hypothetical protein
MQAFFHGEGGEEFLIDACDADERLKLKYSNEMT